LVSPTVLAAFIDNAASPRQRSGRAGFSLVVWPLILVLSIMQADKLDRDTIAAQDREGIVVTGF